MKKFPFLVRKSASIALGITGVAAVWIRYGLPEEWRPANSGEGFIGFLGFVLIVLSIYAWIYWDPTRK